MRASCPAWTQNVGVWLEISLLKPQVPGLVWQIASCEKRQATSPLLQVRGVLPRNGSVRRLKAPNAPELWRVLLALKITPLSCMTSTCSRNEWPPAVTVAEAREFVSGVAVAPSGSTTRAANML